MSFSLTICCGTAPSVVGTEAETGSLLFWPSFSSSPYLALGFASEHAFSSLKASFGFSDEAFRSLIAFAISSQSEEKAFNGFSPGLRALGGSLSCLHAVCALSLSPRMNLPS
jgi:hypothetical protein